MMEITIAIVCSKDHLIKQCLDSIKQDISIIVVLNFPDDFVLSVVNSDRRVTIVRLDERNLGKLRQAAVDLCNTPAICFIDSDCVFSNGSIESIQKELDSSLVVNIPIHFLYSNPFSKVVAECRRYTTPDHLLYTPLAFQLKVQQIIGPFFNEKLTWGEDSDQRQRLKDNSINYQISDGVVFHKPLSIKEDIQSAMRLGRGTYIREFNTLSKPRNIFNDLSIVHEIKSALTCFRQTGFWAATYHFFVWRPSYKLGYWKARRAKNE